MGMKKPVGILVFPGTQCDQDTKKACEALGLRVGFIWHQDHFDFKQFSALILPGGFSYGDYLRAGALAAKSFAVNSLMEGAGYGLPVLGICNGFQILCEAGLLPGTLVKNIHQKFIDTWVELELKHSPSFWSSKKTKFILPIAHSEGRYIAEESTLKNLKDKGQIWMTYKETPNGSLENIAGILNKKKNVAGLMPHPERAFEKWMGSEDGFGFFDFR